MNEAECRFVRGSARLYRRVTGCAAALALLAGCNPWKADGGGVAEVPIWSLGAPTLQLGAVEGAGAQQFAHVAHAMRLGDGRVVVLDGGARELRYFGQDGRHLHTTGRAGSGPGEFRWPIHLFRASGDTVRVFDAAGSRFSIFDPAGTFVRVETLPRDTSVQFPLHIWLHGVHLVTGGLTEHDRDPVRSTLDRLVPMGTERGFATVHVTAAGELWIGDPAAAGHARTWHVVGRDGRVKALIPVPDRFELLEVHDDAVVGRWRDEDDVEYVRLYALRRSANDEGERPTLFSSEQDRAAIPPDEESRRLADLMRTMLRQVVTAQERHYASHATYAQDADSLELERPVGVTLTLLSSSRYGWVAVAVHRRASIMCAMGVGVVPGAWREGLPVCG